MLVWKVFRGKCKRKKREFFHWLAEAFQWSSAWLLLRCWLYCVFYVYGTLLHLFYNWFKQKPKLSTLKSQRTSALISFDSKIVSADQRRFSSDPALYISWKFLISTELSSSEEHCSAETSADFLSPEQRWFGKTQSSSTLKQRWSALAFFVSSGSELDSAEETPNIWNSVVQRWLALGLQPA